MDDPPTGVWYVSGNAHAENGVYANIQDGKEPSCIFAGTLIAALILVFVVYTLI